MSARAADRKRTAMERNRPRAGTAYHVTNILLCAGSVLLCAQSLAARSVSAGWDLGLLLPAMLGMLGLALLGVRLLLGRRILDRGPVRRIVMLACAAGLSVFVLAELLIVTDPLLHGAAQYEPEPGGTAWVIVLGCGIKPDATPTWALANRLDAALAWYRAHPGSRLVVSGGQGANEPEPEAVTMARYLTDRGVPASDVLLEDRSTSTMENFAYSIDVMRTAGWTGGPVLFATNDFHIFRARMLAARNGLEAYGIPAATPPVIWLNVYLREFFALGKSLAVDWPAA